MLLLIHSCLHNITLHTCHVALAHLRQAVEYDGPALGEGGAHPAAHCAWPGAVIRLGSEPEAFSLDCRDTNLEIIRTQFLFSLLAT